MYKKKNNFYVVILYTKDKKCAMLKLNEFEVKEKSKMHAKEKGNKKELKGDIL